MKISGRLTEFSVSRPLIPVSRFACCNGQTGPMLPASVEFSPQGAAAEAAGVLRLAHPGCAELVGKQETDFGTACQEQTQLVQAEVALFQRTGLEVLPIVPALADEVQQGAGSPFVFVPMVGDVAGRGVEVGDGCGRDGVGQMAEPEVVEPAVKARGVDFVVPPVQVHEDVAKLPQADAFADDVVGEVGQQMEQSDGGREHVDSFSAESGAEGRFAVQSFGKGGLQPVVETAVVEHREAEMVFYDDAFPMELDVLVDERVVVRNVRAVRPCPSVGSVEALGQEYVDVARRAPTLS